MDKVCFGVDLGGTSVKMGMFDLSGKELDKWSIPTRKEEQGRFILGDIADSIKEKMEEHSITINHVIGVGMGVPGPVTEDGTVLKCANLGWDIVDVTGEMQKLMGIHNIKVNNDANVAALGEMWQGGGKGFKNLVMVTLGTGVGGGVIVNGKILSGSNGAAGEIGHITVSYEEKFVCGCGKKGCLEQYVSAKGIARLARYRLKHSRAYSRMRHAPHISAKTVFDAAKTGDKFAIRQIDEFGKKLGMALAQVAQVIDPEVFVIGGGVSRAGKIILDVVKKNYEENVMFALKDKEFRLAQLGNDAGIYGSAKMVLEDK